MGTRDFLVVDANVLIDYLSSDRTILTLAAQHVGPVHVPRSILGEVEGLSEDECRRLGLVVVDETLDQLIEAGASSTSGPLSFNDRLCLLLARDGRWTCVSNDGPLRRACGSAGVQVRWGLELMVELVTRGHLASSAGITVAEAIHVDNPRFITRKIVDLFITKVREIERARR